MVNYGYFGDVSHALLANNTLGQKSIANYWMYGLVGETNTALVGRFAPYSQTNYQTYGASTSNPIGINSTYRSITPRIGATIGALRPDLQSNLNFLNRTNQNDNWQWSLSNSGIASGVSANQITYLTPGKGTTSGVNTYRSSVTYNYVAGTNINFTNAQTTAIGYDRGYFYRSTDNSIINDSFSVFGDSLIGYNESSFQYNSFSINSSNSFSRNSAAAWTDFKATSPILQTGIGGLGTMASQGSSYGKDVANDALFLAGNNSYYLIYHPSAATSLSAIPASVKTTDLHTGGLNPQWYLPSGTPIITRYKEGDILTKSGHYIIIGTPPVSSGYTRLTGGGQDIMVLIQHCLFRLKKIALLFLQI